jgi:hypothetical protein
VKNEEKLKIYERYIHMLGMWSKSGMREKEVRQLVWNAQELTRDHSGNGERTIREENRIIDQCIRNLCNTNGSAEDRALSASMNEVALAVWLIREE